MNTFIKIITTIIMVAIFLATYVFASFEIAVISILTLILVEVTEQGVKK